MKEDIIETLSILLVWIMSVTMFAAGCFLLGLCAKLAWIPLQVGWNLI